MKKVIYWSFMSLLIAVSAQAEVVFQGTTGNGQTCQVSFFASDEKAEDARVRYETETESQEFSLAPTDAAQVISVLPLDSFPQDFQVQAKLDHRVPVTDSDWKKSGLLEKMVEGQLVTYMEEGRLNASVKVTSCEGRARCFFEMYRYFTQECKNLTAVETR